MNTELLYELIVELLTAPVEGHQKEIWEWSQRLKEVGFSQTQIERILSCRWRNYHLNADPAIKRASHRVFDHEGGDICRWPSRCQAEVDKVMHEQSLMNDEMLKMASPEVNPEWKSTREILDRLYPDDPLLCMGESVDRFRTKPKSEFLAELDHPEANLSHLVPNPMSKPMGRTMDGRESIRCRDNAGPLRFLIVDLDDEPDYVNQSEILWDLKQFLPLTMVIHSGNQSLHGWFYAEGCPDERLSSFKSRAALIGADTSLYRPEQAARTPNQVRDNGNPQSVWYFDDSMLRTEGGES